MLIGMEGANSTIVGLYEMYTRVFHNVMLDKHKSRVTYQQMKYFRRLEGKTRKARIRITSIRENEVGSRRDGENTPKMVC